MKKTLLALLFILIVSLPVSAANFVELGRDEDYLIYVDINSIEERSTYGNNYIVAWVKWIPRGEALKELSAIFEPKSVDCFMSFYAYDKNHKRGQRLMYTLYDKKGNVIVSDSQAFSLGQYQEIIPGSYSELFYDMVMLHYNNP